MQKLENNFEIENNHHQQDDYNDDDDDTTWQYFGNIDTVDPPKKRDICSDCQRPESVCFCLDIQQIKNLKNHLIILQHPNELKRCLRTTKILELSISKNNYHLFNGKRFTQKRYPKLFELFLKRENILLYPSLDAEPLENIEIFNENGNGDNGNNGNNNDDYIGYNVIMLDGTWSQARVLYNTNSFLHSMKCIKLQTVRPSQYVIRTQPTEICLSTVEAAAIILCHLESNSKIYEILTRPLKTICNFQLNKGAVEHQSKEFLITNGLYTKPLNKKIQKKLLLQQQQQEKDEQTNGDNNNNNNTKHSLSNIKNLVSLLDR